MKQLRFFFPTGIICGMITAAFFLASKNGFALEQLPPFAYYEVIEQRNFFRPKTETAEAVRKEEPGSRLYSEHTVSDLDKYVLTGIVKIRGKYKATITDKNTENGYYTDINDLIDGFKIVDIRHDRVILERDNETFELKINTPASRVPYVKPAADEKSSAETAPPQKPFTPGDKMTLQTNITESIRMGTPNARKK